MRRFRYSIASLLLAVTVISIGLGIYQYLNPPPAYLLSTFADGFPISDWTDAFDNRYRFTISHEAIEQSPVWDNRRGNPPLSAYEAMVRADKLRSRMIKDGKLADNIHDGEWEIISTELRPAGWPEGHWYWLVRFEYVMSQTGPPNQLLVPVLMDGTVVEPTLDESE